MHIAIAALARIEGAKLLAGGRGPFVRNLRLLLANAGSMVGSIAVTSALGFPYWWLAARMFPAHAVGFAAASVSGMTLVGTLGMLGMGTFLSGELPRQAQDRGPAITTALSSAACAGLALGVLFALLLPGPLGLRDVSGRLGPMLLFAIGGALTSTTMVADQALVGLLRGRLQFHRNVIFAAAKLAVLAAIGLAAMTAGGLAIYATWVVGMAISLGWLAGVAYRRGPLLRWRPQWTLLWGWRQAALEHHLLNLALVASVRALPLVVAAVVSVTASAYYYAALLIAGFLAYGSVAVTYALYAVGIRDVENLARTLRFTLGFAFALLLGANLILWVGADFIMGLFGPGYASHAAMALRIMGLDALLMIVKDHYVAIARIRGTLRQAAALAGPGAALEVALAALGGSIAGITGVALGAVAGLGVQVGLMSRTVFRELRGDSSRPRARTNRDRHLPGASR